VRIGTLCTVLLASGLVACGRVPVPVPPAAANTACVSQCQQTHAVCLQGTGAPVQAYGDVGAALVGGIIDLAISRSATNRCTETLKSCYDTCGYGGGTQEANVAAACQQLRCPDGSPGLWIGQAGSLGVHVTIAAYLCQDATSGRVVGQWSCAQAMPLIGCLTEGGGIDGRAERDSLRLVSTPLPGGRVSRCEFGGPVRGLRFAGDYECTGTVSQKGT
jgi:hypothetical protein